jgi:DNA-binding CsgD family transcriptional regulator
MCRAELPASRDKGPSVPVRESGRGKGEGVLTHRERQVLNHLADGHTTREIATLLSISGKTVRNHIEHILHKLHAHSRLEAVAVSRRLDLH